VLVLGVDPGTATTGYALVAEDVEGNARLVRFGVIETRAHEAMAVRLRSIHADLSALIGEAAPEAMAVEELFFSRNVSTALSVGQARGVVLLAAAQAGLPVYEYKPAEVKQALVGYGGASKAQMQEMVRMMLGLPEVPRPDDAADAIAVAICHLHGRRLRQLIAQD
jgi:crossover junction endodeoxyribonuclease RuvC